MRITGMTVKKRVLTAETHVHLQPFQDPFPPQRMLHHVCYGLVCRDECMNSKQLFNNYGLKALHGLWRKEDHLLLHERGMQWCSPSQGLVEQRSQAAVQSCCELMWEKQPLKEALSILKCCLVGLWNSAWCTLCTWCVTFSCFS